MTSSSVSPSHIAAVSSSLEANKSDLNNVSQAIWNKPETMFNEVFAHQLLTEFLEKQGFTVAKRYGVDPTAFRAEFQSANYQKGVHPTVGVMCEYDALPEIGHACGHNLIATSAIATGLAVRDILRNLNLQNDAERVDGRLSLLQVVVLGTPAEEGGGGKVNLINHGAFQDIDFAMMVHPFANNDLEPVILGIERVAVEFQGKAAHASCGPWEGVNALDAAVALYHNVSLFRQQMQPNWRIHGIIMEGGTKPNIIPDHTKSNYYLRTITSTDMAYLKERFLAMVNAAASATGCTVNVMWEPNPYTGMLHNSAMSQVYKSFSEADGVIFPLHVPGFNGSTDMGNVSLTVPSIHPGYALGRHSMIHTRDFEALAGTPEGLHFTLLAAKSMALTCTELFLNKNMQEQCKREFAERIKGFTTN
ncbi:hypothetical protein RvY_00794 [Ramazzottius varieornatus]|uniref:Peptidase M20 domain-containing protein 2 n=1 Tax=Ramazzottius varieornatus TaxID=947166 RepID=A0A1D1UK63_RAMVA|nr:hypothetical protein RvY_00794 [Ramazzottius varieornatus]